MDFFLLMFFQLCFVVLGADALLRILRHRSRPLDMVQTALGLCAATQFNINMARMRYGATSANFSDSWDWSLSNYLGVVCFIFLLLVVVNTGKALR